MTKPDLHEATIADAISAKGDRFAAELIESLGEPTTYEKLHTLVSVAYLQGAADELKRWTNHGGGA